MNEFLKSARIEKAVQADAGEMALINAHTLRELTAEEVFVFRMAACDDQVDRDWERFTHEALRQMAELFPGHPVLMDHKWSAGVQTARVYAASVETMGERAVLVLRCYMPRNAQTQPTIDAIEGGILREASVGCSVKSSVCSICGVDQMEKRCPHCHGQEYDGKTCWFDLSNVQDVYEASLVAVPAQPEAGIIKSKRYQAGDGRDDRPPEGEDKKKALALARARQELENIRFGGI